MCDPGKPQHQSELRLSVEFAIAIVRDRIAGRPGLDSNDVSAATAELWAVNEF